MRWNALGGIFFILSACLLDGCGYEAPQVGGLVEHCAQRYPGSNFDKIDKAVLHLSAHDQQRLDKVAEAIEQVAETDWERIRGVWTFITHSIAYDERSKGRGGRRQSPENVFQQRRATCSGYSRIFIHLAGLLGLEAFEVVGYAKDESPPSLTGKLAVNHSWVMVSLNGGKHLFDPTWGAGALKGGRFRWHYREAYFDVAPQQFVFNHFPIEPKHQLLTTPLDQATFLRLPYIHPTAFSYGLQTGGILHLARNGTKVTAPQFFTCAISPSFIQVPMRDTLIEGQVYRFRLTAPTSKMSIQTGVSDPVFIEGVGGHFDFSLRVSAGRLILGMVTSVSQRSTGYSYLLSYNVRRAGREEVVTASDCQ